MKRYQLEVRGGLFFTQAALMQQDSVRVVGLLIDSGATYTIDRVLGDAGFAQP